MQVQMAFFYFQLSKWGENFFYLGIWEKDVNKVEIWADFNYRDSFLLNHHTRCLKVGHYSKDSERSTWYKYTAHLFESRVMKRVQQPRNVWNLYVFLHVFSCNNEHLLSFSSRAIALEVPVEAWRGDHNIRT